MGGAFLDSFIGEIEFYVADVIGDGIPDVLTCFDFKGFAIRAETECLQLLKEVVVVSALVFDVGACPVGVWVDGSVDFFFQLRNGLRDGSVEK